ncbi:MAG TPA: hypothetical protein VGJ99_08625 [Actinomycetota bacterium]
MGEVKLARLRALMERAAPAGVLRAVRVARAQIVTPTRTMQTADSTAMTRVAWPPMSGTIRTGHWEVNWALREGRVIRGIVVPQRSVISQSAILEWASPVTAGKRSIIK